MYKQIFKKRPDNEHLNVEITLIHFAAFEPGFRSSFKERNNNNRYLFKSSFAKMKEEKRTDRWRWWLTKHASSPQLRKALTLLHRNPVCCGFDQAPFPEQVFKTCFPIFEHLVRNMTSLLGNGIYEASGGDVDADAGKSRGEIRGYKLHVKSKLIFSLSFVKMKKHFELVEKDIDKMNKGDLIDWWMDGRLD